MIIFFILGLLLGSVAVVFALQNVEIVTVTFFQWHVTSSLAVILISAILAGVVVASLILIPGSISKYFKNRTLRKEIGRLEEELRKQKELTVFGKNTPPTVETISHIEQGAIEDKK
ncbi:MAG: LapA family protein [Patescibacteria group bacterium]